MVRGAPRNGPQRSEGLPNASSLRFSFSFNSFVGPGVPFNLVFFPLSLFLAPLLWFSTKSPLQEYCYYWDGFHLSTPMRGSRVPRYELYVSDNATHDFELLIGIYSFYPQPGQSFLATCGQSSFNSVSSDPTGHIEEQTPFNAGCEPTLCRGMVFLSLFRSRGCSDLVLSQQFADQPASNVQTVTPGQAMSMAVDCTIPHGYASSFMKHC